MCGWFHEEFRLNFFAFILRKSINYVPAFIEKYTTSNLSVIWVIHGIYEMVIRWIEKPSTRCETLCKLFAIFLYLLPSNFLLCIELSCTTYGIEDNLILYLLVDGDVNQMVLLLQLRNLLWATSKHDVYLVQNYSVMHWSSLLRGGKEVLNAAGRIVPKMVRICANLLNLEFVLQSSLTILTWPSVPQKHHGSQTISRVQVSTICVKDNLMIGGGFQGELICKV